ncbi:GNAT family N-acetyltransferase [Helicobacter pullorum]|uniref:GNAT family N-acetyltransferase n=1 Tax=Helicobacter pullorum TaxID=35818 RepID=UPI0009BEE345|nr:GNAT family protein [Helicobacter pullorum]
MAVCLKHTNEFIGNLFGLWEKDTFSVCWNFLPNYCGKGYAYESAKAYLDYLFNHMNARRIYAYVEDYNISSQRLCKKLGMRQECLFKEFISFINNPDGTPLYENTMQFAILKKEWNKQSQI